MSREVLRDAIVYLPARVIPALVGVVAVPVLTRLLSPQAYGQYLLALTSLTLIVGLTITWLVSITVRFYVIYGVDSLFKISRPLIAIALVAGGASWIVVASVLGSPFTTLPFLSIGLLWLITYAGFEYFAGWFRVRGFAKFYSLVLCWRSIGGLLTTIALLSFASRNGETALLGTTIAMLIVLPILPRYALQPDCAEFTNRDYRDSESPLRAVLRYGMPAAISNLVIAGLSLADRYVIHGYLGTESVAVYGANYDLAEKTIFFINSMLLLSSSVIGFRIYEQEGEAKAAVFLAKLMRFYLISAPLLVAGLAALSPQIVQVLLPPKYSEGVMVLPVVALGGLFVGVMHRYSLLLSFHKRTGAIMWCSVGALAINLVACFLLIPTAGLIGAAVSTLLAYGCWLLFIRVCAARHLVPAFPWKTLGRIACTAVTAAGVMYIVVRQLSSVVYLGLVVSFVTGTGVYCLMLFCLREISAADLSVIARSVRGRFDKT